MLDPRRRIALNSVTMIIWFVFFGMRIFSRYYGRQTQHLGMMWYLADFFVFVAVVLVSISNCLDTWTRHERLKQDPNPWITDGPKSLIIASYKVRLTVLVEELVEDFAVDWVGGCRIKRNLELTNTPSR